MLNANETRKTVKTWYEGILAQENVGHLSFIINMHGDSEFMDKLFTVQGFRELLSASLPPEQRTIGHLAR